MENNQEKSKKKILLTYLIAVICLLVIAAVTVTLVLTVGKSSPTQDVGTIQDPIDEEPTIGGTDDNSQTPSDDQQVAGNGTDDETQVSVSNAATMPITEVNILNSHAVLHYDTTLDRYCEHQGIDFSGNAGDEVYAILDGTVTDIVLDDTLYGNYITITHDNNMTTTYKYIDIAENLNLGDSVKKGEKIGSIATACGNEYADGAHLHFELYSEGKLCDPATILDFDEK
jgi:murein DD-endopeptidase MepM/ murein hydrolase activator NlpD